MMRSLRGGATKTHGYVVGYLMQVICDAKCTMNSMTSNFSCLAWSAGASQRSLVARKKKIPVPVIRLDRQAPHLFHLHLLAAHCYGQIACPHLSLSISTFR